MSDLRTGVVVNDDLTAEAFQSAVAFAIRAGKLSNFLASLERLNCTRDPQGRPLRHVLYKDFAPYSFEWTEYVWDGDQWRPGLNGGLIYHGLLLDGSRPETFSVTLEPEEGWSLHT